MDFDFDEFDEALELDKTLEAVSADQLKWDIDLLGPPPQAVEGGDASAESGEDRENAGGDEGDDGKGGEEEEGGSSSSSSSSSSESTTSTDESEEAGDKKQAGKPGDDDEDEIIDDAERQVGATDEPEVHKVDEPELPGTKDTFGLKSLETESMNEEEQAEYDDLIKRIEDLVDVEESVAKEPEAETIDVGEAANDSQGSEETDIDFINRLEETLEVEDIQAAREVEVETIDVGEPEDDRNEQVEETEEIPAVDTETIDVDALFSEETPTPSELETVDVAEPDHDDHDHLDFASLISSHEDSASQSTEDEIGKPSEDEEDDDDQDDEDRGDVGEGPAEEEREEASAADDDRDFSSHLENILEVEEEAAPDPGVQTGRGGKEAPRSPPPAQPRRKKISEEVQQMRQDMDIQAASRMIAYSTRELPLRNEQASHGEPPSPKKDAHSQPPPQYYSQQPERQPPPPQEREYQYVQPPPRKTYGQAEQQPQARYNFQLFDREGVITNGPIDIELPTDQYVWVAAPSQMDESRSVWIKVPNWLQGAFRFVPRPSTQPDHRGYAWIDAVWPFPAPAYVSIFTKMGGDLPAYPSRSGMVVIPPGTPMQYPHPHYAPGQQYTNQQMPQQQQYTNQQMPQQQQYTNQQMPQQQQYTNQQIPQQQQYTNQQMSQQQQYTNQQMPQQQQYTNQQMPQQQYMNQQIPQQQQYMNQQMPPQQQYIDPQMPPQQQYMDQQMPPQQQYMDPQMPPQQQYMDPQMPPQQQYMDPQMPPQQQYMDQQMPQHQQYMDQQMPQHQQYMDQQMPQQQLYMQQQYMPVVMPNVVTPDGQIMYTSPHQAPVPLMQMPVANQMPLQMLPQAPATQDAAEQGQATSRGRQRRKGGEPVIVVRDGKPPEIVYDEEDPEPFTVGPPEGTTSCPIHNREYELCRARYLCAARRLTDEELKILDIGGSSRMQGVRLKYQLLAENEPDDLEVYRGLLKELVEAGHPVQRKLDNYKTAYANMGNLYL